MHISDIPSADYFIYHGRENERIPRDVTHAKTHPSVRAIKDYAFYRHRQLEVVILNYKLEVIGFEAFKECLLLVCIKIPKSVKKIKEGAFDSCFQLRIVTLENGLEDIGVRAFSRCTSLVCIRIPNSVKTIKGHAFSNCSGLTAVIIGSRVSWIGGHAFSRCTSLEEIFIPNAVKEIQAGAFWGCTRLTTVNLGTGLKLISMFVFRECTSLVGIVILTSVRYIDHNAFENCTNLTNVEFCDQIKEFVSCNAIQDWWNHGVHERSLSTYCLLVRYSIPQRLLGISVMSSSQISIHEKLRRIPTIDVNGMNAYFDTIHLEIRAYENFLEEAPMMFPEQLCLDDFLVQNILSFL